MSASNNNNRHATFELTEFNKNPPPKNENKEIAKPHADYTGFNHADFASWSKSSTEKEYKPFNQPQINADRQQRVIRPDNEWFDYAAFITLAKTKIAQN